MMKLWHTAVGLVKRTLAYSDQAVVSGTNFLVGIILARALGMDAYGTFVLGWMGVLFASSLQQAIILNPLYTLLPKKSHESQDASFENVIASEERTKQSQESERLPRGVHAERSRSVRNDEASQFKGGIVAMQIALTVLTVIIGYASIPVLRHYLPEHVSEGFLIVLPLVMGAFVTQDFLRRMLFVEGKANMALVGDIVAYGLQLPILGLIWMQGTLSLEIALIVIGSCFTISTIVNLVTLRFEPITLINQLTINSALQTLRECWEFAKYLVATSLLQWFSGNAFIVVAGGIVGPAAVGAVRIAQNVMGVLHVLFLAMENTVPIKAAVLLKEQGEAGMMDFFRKVTANAGLITIGLAGSVAVFAKPILGFLYGEAYINYNDVLAAFAALYLLIFLGTVLRFVIRTIEKNQFIFITYLLTTIFSVIGAQPIVETYGVYGILLGLFGVHAITLIGFIISLWSEIKLMFGVTTEERTTPSLRATPPFQEGSSLRAETLPLERGSTTKWGGGQLQKS